MMVFTVNWGLKSDSWSKCFGQHNKTLGNIIKLCLKKYNYLKLSKNKNMNKHLAYDNEYEMDATFTVATRCLNS